jgi:hypothetical protein
MFQPLMVILRRLKHIQLKNTVAIPIMGPIPVAVRSNAWVWGRSLAGIAGSKAVSALNKFKNI